MRAYKNKKYNPVNYVNYSKNPKYFGLQAGRFPSSIKRQFCNTHANYYEMEGADVTLTIRRSPAVYKGSGCVTVFDPAPEYGPTLEASIIPPVLGPSSMYVVPSPALGPTGVQSTIIAPALGPSSLSSNVPQPAAGPASISSTLQAPQAGPQSVTSNILVPPQAGPSSLSGITFNSYDQTELTDFDPINYFGAVVVTGHGAANGFYQGHIISGNYIWKRVALLNCTDSPTHLGGHSAQITYVPSIVGTSSITPGRFIVATLDGNYSYTHSITIVSGATWPEHTVTVVPGVSVYIESVHGCGNGTYPI